jgi:uncharacterized protein with FMN-binding domain
VRRAVIIAVTTSAGVFLMLWLKPHHNPVLVAAPPPDPVTRTHSGSAAPRDGSFDGAAVRTPYGSVKVAATLRSGRLVAVRVLEIPSATGRDRDIASFAVPRLTQEALGAQSAHIDAVSGASYTSQGYIDSLQSALDRSHD